MSLLSLSQISYTWGGPLLLDGIDLEIGKGERIGLLGRNGCGKSTLMKILAGEIEPDDGEIRRANGLKVARLIQEVPQGYEGRVAEMVAEGCTDENGHPVQKDEDWKVAQAVKRVLSRMKLNGDDSFATLSSGMKRRVLLAKALAGEPDILLLDEPTNHLDIASIAWLERFLKGYDGTLVFVTHDRVFLKSLATRIIEIDRGRLFDWTCDYPTFLRRKEAALHEEDQQNLHFDRKLAEEEVWIRQGIKARRANYLLRFWQMTCRMARQYRASVRLSKDSIIDWDMAPETTSIGSGLILRGWFPWKSRRFPLDWIYRAGRAFMRRVSTGENPTELSTYCRRKSPNPK